MLAVAHGLLGRPPLPILSSQSLSGVFRYFGNISVRESPSSRVAQTLGHVATPPRLGASGCQFGSGEDRTITCSSLKVALKEKQLPSFRWGCEPRLPKN